MRHTFDPKPQKSTLGNTGLWGKKLDKKVTDSVWRNVFKGKKKPGAKALSVALCALVLSGCAIIDARGNLCNQPAHIQAWTLFREPTLTVTCQDNALTYDDPTAPMLSQLLALMAKIAAAMPK